MRITAQLVINQTLRVTGRRISSAIFHQLITTVRMRTFESRTEHITISLTGDWLWITYQNIPRWKRDVAVKSLTTPENVHLVAMMSKPDCRIITWTSNSASRRFAHLVDEYVQCFES